MSRQLDAGITWLRKAEPEAIMDRRVSDEDRPAVVPRIGKVFPHAVLQQMAELSGDRREGENLNSRFISSPGKKRKVFRTAALDHDLLHRIEEGEVINAVGDFALLPHRSVLLRTPKLSCFGGSRHSNHLPDIGAHQ